MDFFTAGLVSEIANMLVKTNTLLIASNIENFIIIILLSILVIRKGN